MVFNYARVMFILIAILLIGYLVGIYQIQNNFFTRNEVIEANGSFDERLNLLEKRMAIMEDSTKSGFMNTK